MRTIQKVSNILVKKLPYVRPTVTQEVRKLPEFLYHFTSAENADKIIKSGKLIAKEEGSDFNVAGVFMFDLDNFVKNWSKLFIDNGEYGSFNFFNALFTQATKGEKHIACFRIPTKRLSKNMVIRDQSNLIKAGEKLNSGEDVSELITKVDDADLYRIYHQKGHAIEFINPGDIKINKEDLVNIAEIPQELTTYVPGKEPLESAFNTLRYLFIKQPEARILERI